MSDTTARPSAPGKAHEIDHHPEANVDADEVARFAALASEWWDPKGKFRPLHQIGPARLQFIRDQICQNFNRDYAASKCLGGLSILDIGCGGGLIAEPMARLGGEVTGIDPAGSGIEAARVHGEANGFAITYRAVTAEVLVAEGAQFDAVLCLEVVEHVPDMASFVANCARLVRPGGVLVLSTINRTIKAYGLAIIGAEYVLRWLPRGTHQWEKFVTPGELSRAVEATGIDVVAVKGMVYNPLRDQWSLSDDRDVNYLMSGRRRA